MKFYIDDNCKCYVDPGDGLTEVESDFFDNKAKDFIEGYRFVPTGHTWIRDDGQEFVGEMISPWKDWNELDAAQRIYEAE